MSDVAFSQVGYVVPDLDRALEYFVQRLGGGPFVVLRSPELWEETFHGRPFKPRQDLAFGNYGHVQYELICPTGGDESTYTQFLDRNPAGGIHHTATVVADLEAGARAIGLTPADFVQTGRSGEGTQFAYLQTPIGAYLELLVLDAPTRGLFDGLRRGEVPEGMEAARR